MRKVNCAVVGAGWWATTAHIPAIKKHPQADLLAVQKRKREAVESLARDFEVPHACTTLEEVLAVPDLDAVVVSSTPNMHFPHETKGSGLFVEYWWLILIRFQDAETKTS
jgi:predicted dehydrogenase